MVHCIYLGVSGYSLKNIVFFCLKIFFTFTNSVDPDECHMMWHFIRVFTVCKSTRLGVSHIQRVNRQFKFIHVMRYKRKIIGELRLLIALLLHKITHQATSTVNHSMEKYEKYCH